MFKRNLILMSLVLSALWVLMSCDTLAGALNAAQNERPASASTQPAATVTAFPTVAPGTPTPSSADINVIKNVILRGNQEQIQAIAAHNPAVMQDTSTATYYQQSAQTVNDLLNSGVMSIQLVNLSWGPITLQDANTAQATTAETWSTTFSDGSKMQETDTNVYTVVRQNGAWLVQDDQHPNSRTLQSPPGNSVGAPTPVAPVAPVAPAGPGQSGSRNWAGYAASGGTFTAVYGTWTVPNVSAGTNAADATWVGIGGVSSRDLIQAGTQATVQSGQVVYSAWWETLPQVSQPVPLTVNAGDTISVSITQQSNGTWQILIHDATSNQSYQRTVTYQSSRSSAEWIEESPVAGRRLLLPLDNFGTVTFTNATTVENGKQLTISQAGGQPITLEASPGVALAQPSALAGNGSSFSVTRTSVTAPRSVPGFRNRP